MARGGNRRAKVRYSACPYFKALDKEKRVSGQICGRKQDSILYYDCTHCILKKKVKVIASCNK